MYSLKLFPCEVSIKHIVSFPCLYYHWCEFFTVQHLSMCRVPCRNDLSWHECQAGPASKYWRELAFRLFSFLPWCDEPVPSSQGFPALGHSKLLGMFEELFLGPWCFRIRRDENTLSLAAFLSMWPGRVGKWRSQPWPSSFCCWGKSSSGKDSVFMCPIH